MTSIRKIQHHCTSEFIFDHNIGRIKVYQKNLTSLHQLFHPSCPSGDLKIHYVHNCTIFDPCQLFNNILNWPVHIWPQDIAWLRSPTKIQHPLSKLPCLWVAPKIDYLLNFKTFDHYQHFPQHTCNVIFTIFWLCVRILDRIMLS